jgi:hypothetical protein
VRAPPSPPFIQRSSRPSPATPHRLSVRFVPLPCLLQTRARETSRRVGLERTEAGVGVQGHLAGELGEWDSPRVGVGDARSVGPAGSAAAARRLERGSVVEVKRNASHAVPPVRIGSGKVSFVSASRARTCGARLKRLDRRTFATKGCEMVALPATTIRTFCHNFLSPTHAGPFCSIGAVFARVETAR